MARQRRSLEDRFWDAVPERPAGSCWEWRQARDREGYGVISERTGTSRYVQRKAHRLSYEWLVGPIPEGLHLDHLCRNRGCVNPDHLEPVTCRENLLRGVGFSAINARKTHCVRGHEYTAENTMIEHGGRSCRECKRERTRAWQAAHVRIRRDGIDRWVSPTEWQPAPVRVHAS